LRASDGRGRSYRLVLATLIVLAALVAACSGATAEQGMGDAAPPGFFPGEVVSDEGQAASSLYLIVFLIAVGVFILVEGLLLVITFRFGRRRTTGELPPQTHGSNKLELVWTIIPALIVTALFVMTAFTLPRTSEARTSDPSLVVDVFGFQWQWTFEYQAEGLSFTGAGREGPQMVVPVGEPVRVRLHSRDVIHSFYVPQFFYKKDVVPGRINELEITIDQPGTYTGQCAEFCGLAHAEMYFSVRAVPRAEYDAWVRAEQEKAQATAAPVPSGQEAIQISASNEETFDQSSVSAPADTTFTIEFVNNDDLPHNVAIKDTPDGLYSGEPIAQGNETVTYNAPALPAGTYEFFCVVHPNMVGELNVGG
jgi:cytochrome c oxidase subunit II